jgi:serine protease Do
LLITLALGIVIGSIVSDDASSAEKQNAVAELKMQGSGTPVVLNEEATLREGFSRIAATVKPAVVNISTQSIVRRRSQPRAPSEEDRMREFFGDDFWERFFGGPMPEQQKRRSLGSGVIVDSEGYILTNNHVVSLSSRSGKQRLADKIEVRLQNGATHLAEVVGVDPESDLAVLKINAGKPLSFVKIGDSSKLSVGDWVLAVGSPLELEQTVTAGIVSATARVVEGSRSFGDYIQTDAAINPGNSGGPLVNMRGEVVGINTFIASGTGFYVGVGFAIPSWVFVNSYNQLVTDGVIERGWLGVAMNTFPMTDEMAEFFGVAGDDPGGIKDGDGVIVTQLIDEKGDPADSGPAAQAGIQAGDVIVKLGAQEIESSWDLRVTVANTPPGKTVPIITVRKGEVQNLKVELAERTLEQTKRSEREGFSLDEKEEEEPRREIGLEFQTLSRRDAKQAGLEDEEGVVILDVTPGSLADDAGLKPRFVITHANGKPVPTARDFKDEVTSTRSGKGVVLRFVTVSSDGDKVVAYTSFVKP